MISETNKPDVKEPSVSSDATQSTTAQTQTGQESKQDSKEPTILEMAQKVHADYAKKEATPKEVQNADKDESQSKESKIQELNPTEKKVEKDGEEKDQKVDNGEESKDGEIDIDELEKTKGPIPYDRFKQVYSKSKELEQVVEDSKPLVEGQRQIQEYCVKNQITQEQFSNLLELGSLINTNPKEAIQRMANIVGELQDQTGDRLPEDLAAEVANGDLTQARASEIAKLRAQTKQGERSQQQFQQQRVQDQQKQMVTEVGNASNQWVSAKQSIDPDYKPKVSPNAPDGKFELVRAKYWELVNQHDEKGNQIQVIKSGKDCQKYLDMAYAEVTKAIANFLPKNTKKVSNLTANNSNSGSEKPPQTIHDVVMAMGRKHGII